MSKHETPTAPTPSGGDRERAIAARLNAATRGPWEAVAFGVLGEPDKKWDVQREGDPLAWIAECGYSSHDQSQPDAEFIAHSRSDVEYLLAALLAARRGVEAARAALKAVLQAQHGGVAI